VLDAARRSLAVQVLLLALGLVVATTIIGLVSPAAIVGDPHGH
jgi:hypothetical protein